MKICKNFTLNTNTFCGQNVEMLNVEKGDILLVCLTLNLLTTTIVALPSNARKWQMGFNSAFKRLKVSSGFWFLCFQGKARPCVEDVGEGLQK
jgi:hypothetical protein